MGWFDGFPFKSREQMEQERKDFEQRVFPLGIEQRDKALVVLRQLARPKVRDEEILFAFINAKDIFRKAADAERGMTSAWANLKNQNRLQDNDRRVVLALVKLDDRAESLAEYPTAQQVTEEISTLDWLK